MLGALVVLSVIGNMVGPPTQTRTTAADATAVDSLAEQPTPTTTPLEPTTATPVAEPAPVVPAARTCTVPDVVGMVHQTAQDTMQAAGLYLLREEDATGRGRVLVLDRNWQTVHQSVAPGAVVDCNTVILLSAKKIGE